MEIRPEEITDEMWNEVLKNRMPYIDELMKDYMSEEDLIDDKIKGLISLFCYEPKDGQDSMQKDLELHYAQCTNDIAIVYINDSTYHTQVEHCSVSINDAGHLQLLVSRKGVPCYAIVSTFSIMSRAGEKLKEFDVDYNKLY